MEEDAPTYRYSPINANHEIRILRLEPAESFDEPLVGGLVVLNWHDVLVLGLPFPTFDCVSYCWGTQHDVKFMVCDNQCLQITKNVDIMLRHLRKRLLPRDLWIDAISINQSDDTEKETQVGIMSMIYSRAHKVHVWLGIAAIDDHIPTVFAALKMLALNKQDSPVPRFKDDKTVLQSSLETFLTREWYTRRWVLQEVKSARTVTVHCGHYCLSWDWIRDGIAELQEIHAGKRSNFPKICISAATARALEGLESLSFHYQDYSDIFSLIWRYHSANCRDERDRIFALYGLLPSSPEGIAFGPPGSFDAPTRCPVNYGKHFSETYIQLAIAAVESGRGPMIIHHTIMFDSLAQQNPKWPSWVPAWNNTRTTRHKEEGGRVADGEPFMTVDKRQDIPRLLLHGQLFPIHTVGVAGQTDDVLDFFNVDTWPSHLMHYEYILLIILLQGIEFAGLLHDQRVINTASVIPEWDRHDASPMDSNLLRKCLLKELNYPSIDEELPEYCPNIFRKEIRKAMYGLTLFLYQWGKSVAPGIAFGEVKIGDSLLWLGPKSPLSYALVVRQVKPSRYTNLTTNTFRIVSCAFGPLGTSHFFDPKGLQYKTDRTRVLLQ